MLAHLVKSITVDDRDVQVLEAHADVEVIRERGSRAFAVNVALAHHLFNLVIQVKGGFEQCIILS